MVNRQIAFRLKSEGKTELVSELRQVQQAFEQTYDGAAISAERASRATGKMDERWAARLRAQLDPLATAQAKYNSELERYSGLAARERISAAELAGGRALALARFDRARERLAVGAVVDDDGPTRGQRAARLNLARQGADVFTMAGMGASPGMIAISLGPQILDGLAGAGIKATGAVVALGSAFAVTAGAAALALKAWHDGEQAALAYERAATGVARTSGLTAGQLEAAASSGANTAKITEGAARDMAIAFARTGRVGQDTLAGLIGLSRDYSSFMGVDAAEATKQLAAAMASPDKAARDLTLTIGLMDQKTLGHINTLMRQGDKMAAQKILYEELDKSMRGHAERTRDMASAWGQVAVNVQAAWEWLGKALVTTPSEKIAKLRKELNGEGTWMAPARNRGVVERELRQAEYLQWINGENDRAAQAAAMANAQAEADRRRQDLLNKLAGAGAGGRGDGASHFSGAETPDRVREIPESSINVYDPAKDWRNQKWEPAALDAIHQRDFRSSELAAEALAKGFRDREAELRDSVYGAVSGGLKLAFGDPSAWQELQDRLTKAIMGTAASRITDFAIERIGPAESERGHFIRDVLADFAGVDGYRAPRERAGFKVSDLLDFDQKDDAERQRSRRAEITYAEIMRRDHRDWPMAEIMGGKHRERPAVAAADVMGEERRERPTISIAEIIGEDLRQRPAITMAEIMGTKDRERPAIDVAEIFGDRGRRAEVSRSDIMDRHHQEMAGLHSRMQGVTQASGGMQAPTIVLDARGAVVTNDLLRNFENRTNQLIHRFWRGVAPAFGQKMIEETIGALHPPRYNATGGPVLD